MNISSFIFTLLLLTSPKTALATTTDIVPQAPKQYLQASTTPQLDIGLMIAQKANDSGINPQMALYIVENESKMNPSIRDGDMNLLCARTGKPVRSRGIWQITECYHPEVPDSVAYDPVKSTDWSIQQLKAGKCYEWSTCPQRNKSILVE